MVLPCHILQVDFIYFSTAINSMNRLLVIATHFLYKQLQFLDRLGFLLKVSRIRQLPYCTIRNRSHPCVYSIQYIYVTKPSSLTEYPVYYSYMRHL